MTQVSESDYKTAQQGNAKVRRDFVKAINLGRDERLVSKREYLPITKNSFSYFSTQGNSPALMNLSVVLDRIDYRLGETTLQVFPDAFHHDYDYFMNSILHHELHHARPYQNPKYRFFVGNILCFGNKPLNNYSDRLAEIPAFMNQVSARRNFPLCQEDQQSITENILPSILDIIKSQAKKLGRDWKEDLTRVLCPSPYDDIVREKYSLE
jgi:hypothetical protein